MITTNKEDFEKKIEEMKKKAAEFSEHELFLSIDAFGYWAWRESHEFRHGRIEMTEEQFNTNQDYYKKVSEVFVDQLARFEINKESIKDKENGEYWKWYKFWKKWKDDMSDEQWTAFDQKLEKKEPIEEFLPKTKWNEEIAEQKK